MKILGIDPGSVATGFGIVERSGHEVLHVAHGTLRPPRSGELADRLSYLHQAVSEVVSCHAPDAAAVEQVFVASNPRTALVLGQARGVVMAALGAAGLAVAEISAREVKQAVVGTGSATKAQVQSMVMRHLSLEARPGPDASDALAVALCRIHTGRLAGLGARGRSRRRSRVGAAGYAVKRSS